MPKNNRKLTTPQSLNAYIKFIYDIMRRSGRAGALQYVPELRWMLFLRILDEREQKEEEQAKALGIPFIPSLEYPYRWQDWASPAGQKRVELQMGTLGGFMSFVNSELIPYLRNLKNKPGATSHQKVISEVFSSTERTYIDTERNLLDILDKIDTLSVESIDDVNAGAASKTNLLFFTKGEPTKEIWYYDLSDINVTKNNPLRYSTLKSSFNYFPKERQANVHGVCQ